MSDMPTIAIPKIDAVEIDLLPADTVKLKGTITKREPTVELAGFYLPPLMLWAGAALIPFVVVRWLLERSGFYRFVWHRALFNLALYVLFIGGTIFIGNLGWL